MPSRADSTTPLTGRVRASILPAVLVLALVSAAGPSTAAKPDPDWTRCDRAAERAARQSGVPLDVLRAITRVETGRRGPGGAIAPWPWTVNMEGLGRWFDNRQEALHYAETEMQAGARSFDVGCFQINFRWHGDAFDSLDAMFDPDRNAEYAARFLARLFAETGDWSRAAGAYHSRTPAFADRYSERFTAMRDDQPDLPGPIHERTTFGDPRALDLSAPLPGGPLIILAAAPPRSAPRASLMPPPELVANRPEPLIRIGQ
ncbi:MAG: lytic transglycosylase domain-containing protein [Pseudooceanicola sp.]|nr:lytic transglycosylase domain-containing protein [Pseudooceanicola sp.]